MRPGVRWRLYVWYLRSIESDDWRAEYGPKYPLIGEVSQRHHTTLIFLCFCIFPNPCMQWNET